MDIKGSVSFKNRIARLRTYTLWLVCALGIGAVVGVAAALFALALAQAVDLRERYSWLLWLLPAAGLVIVWAYEHALPRDRGTNAVLLAVRGEEQLPPQTAPMIFASTFLTQLFGGSAGREGAALQLGAGIADTAARLLHLREDLRTVALLCGMSAAFSAAFGTPVAAAVFAVEIAAVGLPQYAALLPCAVSALTANLIALRMGVPPERYELGVVPNFGVRTAVLVLLAALICALVSKFFCAWMHAFAKRWKKWIANPYLHVLIGGAAVCLLTLVLGTRDYIGAGAVIIERAMEGEAVAYAFLLKMLFTALTLSSGYRGGELLPSLCIGASLGCTLGKLFGFCPPLCAAVGMIALFCGISNCPLAALVIGVELFGGQMLPYLLLTTVVSYAFSGDHGIYEAQVGLCRHDRLCFDVMNAKGEKTTE